jgi:TolA-binding protein
VVQGFPKSSQVPTSLLKQGLAFQTLGDGSSAKLLYQKVLNSYPKSYAAGVARERLKGL